MADPAVYNAILQENAILQTCIQGARVTALRTALAACPTNTTLWACIPLISNPVGCLCVYDNTSNFLRCGVCCLWTVPAGVTTAQFQIWGAGSGTGMAQCCGGSPHGANGAYATTIISVTPGWTYTLCAGCAFCCYGTGNQTSNTPGCASFVTGCRLTNFCAMGGQGNIACYMRYLHSNFSQCRYRGTGTSDTQGPCLCATASHYCFSNSCGTGTAVPFIADLEQTFYGTATDSTVFGIPAVRGGSFLDGNNYGYHQHAPVISPCHTLQTGSCCCFTFSSGSCCGGCRCRGDLGIFCYPGAGGFATHQMGGATDWAGDAGRGGMVRVTWC